MTGSLRWPPRLGPWVLFGGLALGLVAAEWQLVHRVAFWRWPGLGAGVAFDLLVVLPGLFYGLVVRRYRLPPRTVAAAVGAGLALTRWLLGGWPLLQGLGWLLPAAEALLTGYSLLRLGRMARAYRAAQRQQPHALENLLAAGRAGLGPLVAMEVAVLRYALLGAWARPEVGVGEVAFSTYQRSGFGALLATLGGMVVVETAAVHLALASWHPLVAWALTVASGYSLLWLLAHGQAVRLRPVLVAGPLLVVRVGLGGRLAVPRAAIMGARPVTSDLPAGPELFNAARLLLAPPNVLLRLAAPQVALGPFGQRRQARYLALYVDEPDALLRLLAADAA